MKKFIFMFCYEYSICIGYNVIQQIYIKKTEFYFPKHSLIYLINIKLMHLITKLFICAMLTTVSALSIETNQTEPFCNPCIFIVNVTDYFIKENNMTLQIVETFVETLCKLIGGGIITKECDFVIDIIQDIYNLLDSGLSPQQICTYLKLCTNTKIELTSPYNEKDSIGHNSSLNHYHNQNSNQ